MIVALEFEFTAEATRLTKLFRVGGQVRVRVCALARRMQGHAPRRE